MAYKEKPGGTPPARMVWRFERADTGAAVAIRYDLSKIQPAQTREDAEIGAKLARGQATPEEARAWRQRWNARAQFVLENAETVPGLFTVETIR